MFIGTLLEKIQLLVKTHKMEDFVQVHPGLYLLGLVSEDTPKGALDYYTGVINITDAAGSGHVSVPTSRESINPGEFLIKVEKKKSNVWSSWLSVGRTNNNDIVIRHPSVSKFHARLDRQGPLGQNTEETRLWITDKGSTKGTKLEGELLELGIRYPLQPEMTITFGEVETVLLDSSQLYHRLSLV